jgi:putative ABC transport system substrate-binding protein
MGFNQLKRRGFIKLLGGAAAWPLAARAQQPDEMRRIGVLVLGNPNPEPFLREFRDGLQKLGYVDGRNIQLEIRSAGAKASALPDAAAQLIRLKVDIIVAWQTPAATAAKQATVAIPIVMTAGNPVETGLVASLSRPGGNVTGMDSFGAQLGGKCIELIRDTVPSARRVAILANAADPFTKSFLVEIDKAANSVGIATQPLMHRPGDDFDASFAEIRKNGADAVIIQPTLLRQAAVDLALKHRLPSFSISRSLPATGGLMSYAASLAPQVHELAGYVDRILKGAKPSDLPVAQPTKFELVINLKTARALGLTIPPTLLARADELIE